MDKKLLGKTDALNQLEEEYVLALTKYSIVHLPVLMEDLQQRVNTNYWQDFTITESGLEVNTKSYDLMKQLFMNDSLRGKRVLDIGSNFGLYGIKSLEYGVGSYVGIEPEYAGLRLAHLIKGFLRATGKHPEEYFAPIEYIHAPFGEFLLEMERFDYIICGSVYKYMYQTFKSHNSVFRLLYSLGGDVYFENPMGVDDAPTKEFLENDIPEHAHDYTRERIIDAAKQYYEVESYGSGIIPTRYVYWMKRK